MARTMRGILTSILRGQTKVLAEQKTESIGDIWVSGFEITESCIMSVDLEQEERGFWHIMLSQEVPKRDTPITLGEPHNKRNPRANTLFLHFSLSHDGMLAEGHVRGAL